METLKDHYINTYLCIIIYIATVVLFLYRLLGVCKIAWTALKLFL